MRNALGLMLMSVVAAALIATGGWFWTSSARSSAKTQAVAAAQAAPALLPAPAKPAASRDPIEVTGSLSSKAPPAPAPMPKQAACANPDALGVSRVVEIDTSGGPGFGFEHFKQIDFLADKEVVLTFDDGPWPGNTPAVLKALADECTKAVFFSIGKHATYHPEILKQVAAAGHTVGTHTWSHANLNSKKLTEQTVKDEIEKGNSAVKFALGTAPAPFFRFPELQHNPAAMAYLGTRNIAMFSCDLDSFDFRAKNAEQIVNTVMTKLEKQGKGIILMHDFQKHTAEAMPELLRRLKAGGYKVVLMRPRAPMQTLAEYDEALIKDLKLPVAGARPVNTIVQTVSQ
ncbi:polysaccharide deacetylase family protein [Bradyrhizobium sp.]|uniref:polysaccharide deacetylase family protein n=1 Tax=Bradyrhizobium sp. TaxID=376 RepID=UPI002D56F3DF|nr:polysaccharide deacetylase family protein [Bradyrhizobium sp.]HZR74850.1 polysaccharide deacetylase family protein [Bradyrhizobium sp.]